MRKVEVKRRAQMKIRTKREGGYLGQRDYRWISVGRCWELHDSGNGWRTAKGIVPFVLRDGVTVVARSGSVATWNITRNCVSSYGRKHFNVGVVRCTLVTIRVAGRVGWGRCFATDGRRECNVDMEIEL